MLNFGRMHHEEIFFNYFELGPAFQEMSFKVISYLELWQPLCSADRNHLCNFGRRHHKEQFCEIILNLDLWFRRICCLKVFLIWSSGSPFVSQADALCNFGRWCYVEQFCEIILICASGSGGDVV